MHDSRVRIPDLRTDVRRRLTRWRLTGADVVVAAIVASSYLIIAVSVARLGM